MLRCQDSAARRTDTTPTSPPREINANANRPASLGARAREYALPSRSRGEKGQHISIRPCRIGFLNTPRRDAPAAPEPLPERSARAVASFGEPSALLAWWNAETPAHRSTMPRAHHSRGTGAKARAQHGAQTPPTISNSVILRLILHGRAAGICDEKTRDFPKKSGASGRT